ncbi:MAG: hypothetical protein WCT12_09780 [Verrucomicrobiota bacterium]
MKARVVSSPWSSFGKLASTLLFAASCELLAAEADHSSQPGITNPPAASATNSQQGTVAVATRPKPSADLAPELQVAEGLLLAIPKSAFGKDYLFSASLIPQAPAATSSGLAGRIVRFELFPDGVDMYESTKGFEVTEDLPARRLLANFAIVRQDAKLVVVDFNQGMRRVFTMGWTEGGAVPISEHDRVLEVPQGRVFEMRSDSGRLIIRQSVQARNRQTDQNLEQRYEVRYFISPYQPGAAEGKEPSGSDLRYTRFFETAGQIETGTGRVSSRIARFDIRQPIVFHYSANTPAELAKLVITAKEDAKRLPGKVDKGYVEVPEFKYDQETRINAAKALDDKAGSFKGWAEDAKSDLNTQLKNEVEASLNLAHFKDFKVSLLSRSVRDWYQKQQDILALLPPAPGNPTLPAR